MKILKSAQEMMLSSKTFRLRTRRLSIFLGFGTVRAMSLGGECKLLPWPKKIELCSDDRDTCQCSCLSKHFPFDSLGFTGTIAS